MAFRESRNVRPLLPAPLTTPAAAAAQRLTLLDQGIALPPRKRGKQVDLACDACKKRKSKCDGRRPGCLACERKGTGCFYDEQGREANRIAGLKRQNNALEEELSGSQHILWYLRQCSESEAQIVLHSLRDGVDIPNIAAGLTTPPVFEVKHLAQGSSETRGRQYSFATTEDSEAEPITISNLPGRLELFYLARQSGLLDEATARYDGNVEKLVFTVDVPKVIDTSSQYYALQLVRSPRFSPELRFGAKVPTLRPEIKHQPFLRLRAQPWTTIIDDDAIFSRLICLWLSYHAPCLPYVYPTLFLDALQIGRTNEHCAPILVNAILALACQYSTDFTGQNSHGDESNPRGFAFYNEAYRFWQAEEGHPSLTHLQALIAMYEYNKLRGKDRMGWILLQTAVQMAIDLRLCNPETGRDGTSDDVKFAERFTGWAIYNYLAVESLAYGKIPRIRRCRAPQVTGPFRPSEFTERWRPFDISEGVLRDSYFWQHWHAFCSLADILVDAACLLFTDEIDGLLTPHGLLVQQAEALTAESSVWHSILPSVLSLEANEMPHNLWLHMNFYMLVLSLDRVSSGSADPASPPRPSFPDPESAPPDSAVIETPKSVSFDASRNIVNLAGIALEHFGHKHRAAYDSQICATAAHSLMQDLDVAQARDHFCQSISLLHTQADRFLFSGALARGILLMAKDLVRAQGKTGSETDRLVSRVLEQNMAVDYVTMSQAETSHAIEMRADGETTRHTAHTRLAGSVSSMFPSIIEALCRAQISTDAVVSTL